MTKKIRIGVVGCGGMGQGHLKQMKAVDGLRLTAVADTDEATARSTGTDYQVPYFSSHQGLIDSKLCDAVLIATPHYFHPVVGREAFRAGLHVLTEKPMAVSVQEADGFLAAARESGRVFSIMHQQRTLPVIRAARRLLAKGKLGQIQRTLMVEPNYRSQAYYNSAGWRGTWSGEGGGVLMNQSPHGIDLFMLLGGLPARVTARTRTRLHEIEVEDEADALLEYENGAWGYYYPSTCEVPGGMLMEITGDLGKMVLQNNTLRYWSLNPGIKEHTETSTGMWTSPEATEEPVTIPEAETGHREIIRNFCAAIAKREPLIAPGEEGIWSMEFINALILSGKKGKSVDIPVNRTEYQRLLTCLQKSSRPRKRVATQRTTDPKTMR